MNKPIEKGTRFGNFVTLGEWKKVGVKIHEKCICDCGNIKWVNRSSLRRGKSKSCGCLFKEAHIEAIRKANTKHGLYGTPIYNIYLGIIKRCNCKTHNTYKNYGGRGIKCLWKSFNEFYNDMGEEYNKHIEIHGASNTSIDRIDNNGDYCKENCRWATVKEQSNNRRTNKIVSYNGDTGSLSDICLKYGADYHLVNNRLHRGWNIKDAIEKERLTHL